MECHLLIFLQNFIFFVLNLTEFHDFLQKPDFSINTFLEFHISIISSGRDTAVYRRTTQKKSGNPPSPNIQKKSHQSGGGCKDWRKKVFTIKTFSLFVIKQGKNFFDFPGWGKFSHFPMFSLIKNHKNFMLLYDPLSLPWKFFIEMK